MSGEGIRGGVAVIVPVRNETDSLARLLDALEQSSVPPREIIVVAAAYVRTRALCRQRNCRYLQAPACRGAQLDLGARSSTAPVLWFLHADSLPDADAIERLGALIAAGYEGGYFRFCFTGPPAWRKHLLAVLVNLRTRLGGIPYGDQGLFVTREAYLACGGFPHQPLFEEVSLVKCLRERGRFGRLNAPIGVSPRRWQADGWLRRSLANRRLAWRYRRGATPAELAAEYYPIRTAEEPATPSKEQHDGKH